MTDWAKLKVVDLKAELKRRGLQQHGLKTELVARLVEADEEQARGEEEGEPEGANEDVPMVDEPAGDDARTESVTPDAEAVEKKPVVEDAKAEEQTVQEENAENEQVDATKADANADETSEPQQLPETVKNGAPPEEAPEVPPNPTADVPIPGKEAGAQSREPTVEEASRAATANAASPPSLEATPAAERQKRKRRSLTPPPTEEAIARKRARADEEGTAANRDSFPAREEEHSHPQAEEPAPMNIDNEEEPQPEKNQETAPVPGSDAPREETPADKPQEMDYERDVAPSVHPATTALYVKNLMRPLRPQDVKAHLVDLATPPRDPLDDDIIVEFFLDQVRTHAFVVFRTTAAAARVRNALHNSVWPNESNRKPLWLDFIPPEKVRDWIETEHASGGPRGRSSARWEVVYENGPDGTVEAHLDEATASTSRAGPPPGPRQPTGPSMMGGDAVPVGPRGYRDPAIPTGPRPVRPGTGPGPRPPPTNPGGTSKRTNSRPAIYYQPVSEDLASRRIDNMRSFYSTDRDRDVGRDINRYSFEDGASFVDRGKEVFEGIRPPHRERAVERERRGGRRRGGGGRGGGRPRSDRYLPPPRDDRRPRHGSEAENGFDRMRD
ncbi:hypothetical protein CDV36_013907 [Fusarium kuroshium]|uniref:SAP domain-containing protein n=1 Tax=Fusarium kuroshium TaxID=2010991 RepID=A0A3M2RMG1_9HYPO|nr:hypothetical protein CDV36_013907 [Fusarium kuroshium]